MRQLATIQKIQSVSPIEGADNLVLAAVLGWKCVVKKGEFNPGDLCVYFEVDSLVPNVPQFAFLAKNGLRKFRGEDFVEREGYRVKTVKLRGQVSQGLALPVSSFFSLADGLQKEGDDVSELLGVYKFEKELGTPGGGPNAVKINNWPGFLPKTDETRIQSVPYVLEKYSDVAFYATEKLDGQSLTFFVKDGEFRVCSRNQELARVDENNYWKNALKFAPFKDKLEGYAVQGEQVGPGIQENRQNFPGLDFYAFNVYDFKNGKYLDYGDAETFCRQIGAKTVPLKKGWYRLSEITGEVPSFKSDVAFNDTDDEARGRWRSEAVEKVMAVVREVCPKNSEGLVFRPHVQTTDPKLGRLTFKAINPEYLLANDE